MSEKIKDGGPAFPWKPIQRPDMALNNVGSCGMSLRDYFAAKAMQGYCAREASIEQDMDDIAGDAYYIADAMLRAREVQP